MSKDYRVLAIAALADELLKSGERQAAKLLLTEAVEPLLKSREDDFVVDIGRVAREVALAKGLTFEHEYVLKGSVRNHVFKIGSAEVEYAKLGREIKVDLRCTSESDPKSVALAKAVVNKICNTYAQMSEVLSKARKKKEVEDYGQSKDLKWTKPEPGGSYYHQALRYEKKTTHNRSGVRSITLGPATHLAEASHGIYRLHEDRRRRHLTYEPKEDFEIVRGGEYDPRNKNETHRAGTLVSYGAGTIPKTKDAAEGHNVRLHYKLRPHEVKALKSAYPGEDQKGREVFKRLRGRHPDMVRQEVARALEAHPPITAVETDEFGKPDLTKSKVSQNRASDGKFSYDGNHDRECAGCGREFGKHLAGPPHLAKGCDGFRPLTKTLEKAKIDDVRHGKTGRPTNENTLHIRGKRSRRNSRQYRELVEGPGSDTDSTYRGQPSHHGWDNANLGGPVDPLAYDGRYRTSYRSRVKDNPTPKLPGGKVSGTYPEEADDVKKGDVTSIIGRKRKEDPPTSEGKTIGTLLPPEAHREAAEHHVQHLMHHNEASQNALQAADRSWLKGDESSRNKHLAMSANHEGHAEKHYEHALSHAKRFGEGKHWVAFVQGLQAPANPSSDRWHQFNPHPHDSALAGRLVDPKKLTKAKVDTYEYGKTGQQGNDEGFEWADRKSRDRSNRRTSRNDPYSVRVPRALPSGTHGLHGNDIAFQQRRLRQTQNLPKPKLPGGRVSGTYPEEADVTKAKVDTYHFGETGKKGRWDSESVMARRKQQYRARRQFRDPIREAIPPRGPRTEGNPDYYGLAGRDRGMIGEHKDPLHYSAIETLETGGGSRISGMPKPRLPRGHNRSHPDYIGTNVEKAKIDEVRHGKTGRVPYGAPLNSPADLKGWDRRQRQVPWRPDLHGFEVHNEDAGLLDPGPRVGSYVDPIRIPMGFDHRRGVRAIPTPKLPKGQDRSHPDYIGTNVDKSINPLALAALAKAIKRAPRNKRALGRKKKTKGVWATGGSSKKPPLKGQHVSGRTIQDQSVGTGGSSIAGILDRILGG